VKELVPIFYEDKIEFEKTHAFLSGKIPLGLLLAFRKQVVLTVPDLREGRTLVERFGLGSLDPEAAAMLLERKFEEKRVVPLLDYPTRYVGLSYLDPLLEKKPPTVIRTGALLEVLSGGKYSEYLNEGKGLFKGRLPGEYFKWFRDGRATKIEPDYIPRVAFSYLRVFGYDPLANLLKKMSREKPVVAADVLYVYTDFLIGPTLDGLCGSPQYDRGRGGLAATVGIRLPRSTVFPIEIGEVIRDAFNVGFPVNPSEEAVDKMYRDRAIERARTLLEAFEIYIREAKGEDAFANMDEIKNALLQASEAVPSIDKELEVLKYVVGIVRIGFFGALMLSPSWEVKLAGFLPNLGYEVLKTRIEDRALPKILGRRAGPLPVAVWDFERAYKKVEEYRQSLREIEGGTKS